MMHQLLLLHLLFQSFWLVNIPLFCRVILSFFREDALFIKRRIVVVEQLLVDLGLILLAQRVRRELRQRGPRLCEMALSFALIPRRSSSSLRRLKCPLASDNAPRIWLITLPRC